MQIFYNQHTPKDSNSVLVLLLLKSVAVRFNSLGHRGNTIMWSYHELLVSRKPTRISDWTAKSTSMLFVLQGSELIQFSLTIQILLKNDVKIYGRAYIVISQLKIYITFLSRLFQSLMMMTSFRFAKELLEFNSIEHIHVYNVSVHTKHWFLRN